MIDFHSHILPEMDDGSESVGESLRMLMLSYDIGIDTVVSTSHYYSDRENIDGFLGRREEKQGLLMRELEGIREIPKIVMGAEVAFFSGMSREKDIHRLCMGNTGYMLLEMPFSAWSSVTMREVKNLMTVRGITPIIAHIERYFPYFALRKNKMFDELLDIGAVVQVNGDALIHGGQKQYIIKLIHAGKIHLLGSDCHNMTDRRPNLNRAFKVLEKEFGYSSLKRIDLFGQKILETESI